MCDESEQRWKSLDVQVPLVDECRAGSSFSAGQGTGQLTLTRLNHGINHSANCGRTSRLNLVHNAITIALLGLHVTSLRATQHLKSKFAGRFSSPKSFI